MNETAPVGEPMIEVRNVTKIYPDGNVRALVCANLSVSAGEFVAVTGPSGCGKSTLLDLLAALDVPTSGTIRVNSYDLNRLQDANRFRRREVGIVFQLHNLLPRLSVVDNVEIAMMGTDRPRKERSAHAVALLRDLGLVSLAQRKPPQLSGGERQRVAIARALANDPPVLFADEPTGSLDSDAAAAALALFARLRAEKGVTIVLVTHDESVAATADRTVHMLDGRVVSDGSGLGAMPASSRSDDS
jgi:ABC-type lipoprotein export system ATPase subunit